MNDKTLRKAKEQKEVDLQKVELLNTANIIKQSPTLNYKRIMTWIAKGKIQFIKLPQSKNIYFDKEQVAKIHILNRIFDEEKLKKEQKKKKEQEEKKLKSELLTKADIFRSIDGLHYEKINRWLKQGKIKPTYISPNGMEYFDKGQLEEIRELNRIFDEEKLKKEHKKVERQKEVDLQKVELLNTAYIIEQLPTLNYKRIMTWVAKGQIQVTQLPQSKSIYFDKGQVAKIHTLNRIFDEEKLKKEQKKKEEKEEKKLKSELLTKADIFRSIEGLYYKKINRWLKQGKIKPTYLASNGMEYFDKGQLEEIRELNRIFDEEKLKKETNRKKENNLKNLDKDLLTKAEIIRSIEGLYYKKINLWLKQGKIKPTYISPKGTAYFEKGQLEEIRELNRL